MRQCPVWNGVMNDAPRGVPVVRSGAAAVRSGVRHDAPLARNDVKRGAAVARYT